MQIPTVTKNTLLDVNGIQMRVDRIVHDGIVVIHQGSELKISQKAVEEIVG